jgi:predicted transcriptional regulator
MTTYYLLDSVSCDLRGCFVIDEIVTRCATKVRTSRALTPAAKLEALKKIPKHQRIAYRALPQLGTRTADEVAVLVNREPVNVATRLKKLYLVGLVKREGRGTRAHPYRWSRA